MDGAIATCIWRILAKYNKQNFNINPNPVHYTIKIEILFISHVIFQSAFQNLVTYFN